MIPAVSYLRMSKESQDTSIAAQRVAIAALAKSGGYRIVREYVDSGISGDATEKRLAFQQMLADVSRGDFKAVLCWDQDRFGRFDSLEAGFWILPLRNAGIQLVTVAQGAIDWNDFAGRIIYTIQQEGKHQFLRDLSRNSNRGKMEAVKRGEWMGGDPPFGYRLGPAKRLVPIEHEAEVVRRIFAMYAGGDSMRKICVTLANENIHGPETADWNANTVSRILCNRVYLGHTVFNRRSSGKYTSIANGVIIPKVGTKQASNDESLWMTTENTHEPLIDLVTFESAQRTRSTNKKFSGPATTHRTVFRSLIRCGWCGGSMNGFWIPVLSDVAYVCSEHQRAGRCNNNRTYQADLLAAVCSHLRTDCLGAKSLAAMRSRLRAMFAGQGRVESPAAIGKRLETARSKLSAAESRLLKVPDDMISIVAGQIRELRQTVADIEHQHRSALAPRSNATTEIDSLISAGVSAYHAVLSAAQKPLSIELASALRAAFASVSVWSIKTPGPIKMESGRSQPNGRWHIQKILAEGRIPEKSR